MASLTLTTTIAELVESGWNALLAELVVTNPKAAIESLVDHEGWSRADAIVRGLDPLAPFDVAKGKSARQFTSEERELIERALREIGLDYEVDELYA